MIKIYRDKVLQVAQNGVKVDCPGLFYGELIVLMEKSHQSIVFAMKSTTPDLERFESLFQSLVTNHFVQCITDSYLIFASLIQTQDSSCKAQTLCPKCVDLAFQHASLPVSSIGVFPPRAMVKQY